MVTMVKNSMLTFLAWNEVSMDIVIHAQSSASGSLIRLLKSLQKADFFSSALPRLTIELPHDIDESSKQFLQDYEWPPPSSGHNLASLLTLHHRIPQYGLTAEENSIRILESFWPADTFSNHVLLLSPQAELSPLFFHYLKYTMLEYKYSSNKKYLHENIFGISLDQPTTYLNDSTKFEPPLKNGTVRKAGVSTGATPFLWQAPNSNAALYFGDKWVELHDFVARSLSSQHALPTPTTLNQKLVSKTYPSWLEYFLKLARARGYWTMYPNFDDQDSLVTIHNDLYHAPEEYAEDMKADVAAAATKSGELTADPANHLSLQHKENPLVTTPLLSILPHNGELPRISDMPLLSWDGERIGVEDITLQSEEYSKIFRREIGGCSVEAEEKERYEMLADDLFCLDDPDSDVVDTPIAASSVAASTPVNVGLPSKGDGSL